MKLMFASDIHGSKFYCEKLIECYRREGAERLILLGDLLYHGARNELTEEYNTIAVTALLNSLKSDILSVRGNCDTEVDQMVLEFPILADYSLLYLGRRMVFLTHGHLYSPGRLPPMQKGDILINGHTHVSAIQRLGDYFYLNPGSISLPKDGHHSYMLYEDGVFTIKDIHGQVLKTSGDLLAED